MNEIDEERDEEIEKKLENKLLFVEIFLLRHHIHNNIHQFNKQTLNYLLLDLLEIIIDVLKENTTKKGDDK